jgi:hypothetical protein
MTMSGLLIRADVHHPGGWRSLSETGPHRCVKAQESAPSDYRKEDR